MITGRRIIGWWWWSRCRHWTGESSAMIRRGFRRVSKTRRKRKRRSRTRKRNRKRQRRDNAWSSRLCYCTAYWIWTILLWFGPRRRDGCRSRMTMMMTGYFLPFAHSQLRFSYHFLSRPDECDNWRRRRVKYQSHKPAPSSNKKSSQGSREVNGFTAPRYLHCENSVSGSDTLQWPNSSHLCCVSLGLAEKCAPHFHIISIY